MVVLASFLTEELKHIFTCISRYIKIKNPLLYVMRYMNYYKKRKEKKRKEKKRKEKKRKEKKRKEKKRKEKKRKEKKRKEKKRKEKKRKEKKRKEKKRKEKKRKEKKRKEKKRKEKKRKEKKRKEKKRKEKKKKRKRKRKRKRKNCIIEQVGIPRLLQPKPLGTGAESDMRAANNAAISIFVTLSSAIYMSMHVLEANNYTAYMYSCTANHGTCTCFVSCDVMLFDNNDQVFLRSIAGFHIPLQCTTQVNTLSFSLVTKLKETLVSSSKNSEKL